MKRRRLVSAAAGWAVAAPAAQAAAGPPAVHAGGPIHLRLATAWPSNAAGAADMVLRFAQRVKALSGGQVQIEVLPADKSGVAPLALLDAVAKGEVDMAHATAYYWTQRSAGFNFFATVPMGMTANEHYAWLRFGGGLALWQQLAAQHGVVALPCGNTGVQMAGWFRRQLTGLESLKGLKLRFPGLGGEVLRKMGAVPVLLPAGEIKQALRDGRLDGAEWITPWPDLALGLHEVCDHYYYPGIHEPGHTLELLVHPPLWHKLGAAHQEILRTAGWLECIEMQAHFSHENAAHLAALQKLKNVQVLRLPNEVMREFRRLTPGVLREATASDALARQIHDSYTTYLRQQLRWAEMADRAYWQARYI
ncbi:TRAP transporter substrate-binding protein [Ideonella sp. BN130291]|uniref:TRAP transporter substrate-binding protein n=1 Tax=Ideonella sp. BN130291 TaxID=3112940 RepID=UPI002E2622B8|nr:TRAP transporter substrate-binding protein [Ideonella sp. BN130291]